MDEAKRGYIYSIKSFQTDKIYIGSTIQKMYKRFSKHKHNYKEYLKEKTNYTSSFEIIKYNDCYVELIKEVYCTKKQLLELEDEEIQSHNNCVNHYLPKHWEGNRNPYKKQKYIKERSKIEYCCECGSTLRIDKKARHNKSNKHKKYLSGLVQ